MGQQYNAELDAPFCEAISAELVPLFLWSSMEFNHHDDCDLDQTVSSALQDFLKTLAQQDTSGNLEEELDQMDEDCNDKLE